MVPHRRLVLDGALRVSASARVFSAAGGEVWLVTAVPERDPRLAAFRDRGVHVVSKPNAAGGVDLAALLADLYAAEARSLLVEGGGVTAASFLAAGLADRVTAYIAPKILGGVGARVPVAGEGAGTILDAIALSDLELVRIGGDVRLSARRRPVA
jgi:diaminohydroxyphosphoribosylaminopyrimidine deaminase/5-amino-6-(5-phosphoribosylamino)uracil reductase